MGQEIFGFDGYVLCLDVHPCTNNMPTADAYPLCLVKKYHFKLMNFVSCIYDLL